MAIKIKEKDIELHQWINSVLLGLISIVAGKIYDRVDKDHDVITGHEFRIASLEGAKKRESHDTISFLDAIIPDKLKVVAEGQ